MLREYSTALEHLIRSKDRMPLVNLDSLKKELTVASVKDRATKLNDRYTSAPSSSSSSSRIPGSSSSRVAAPAASASTGNRIVAPASAAPLPPRRATGPVARQSPVAVQEPQQHAETYGNESASHRVDWQNISSQDKAALFSTLDQVGRKCTSVVGSAR